MLTTLLRETFRHGKPPSDTTFFQAINRQVSASRSCEKPVIIAIIPNKERTSVEVHLSLQGDATAIEVVALEDLKKLHQGEPHELPHPK